MTLAVAEMYTQGVSTRKVMAVVPELCALEINSTQVSRAAAELDELGAWRSRPIGEITDLFLDARYEKVHHDGAIVPCALLTAIEISPDGKRSILGCSVQLSEAVTQWRKFLECVVARGMYSMKLVVSDDHAELKAARQIAAWFEGNVPEALTVLRAPAAQRRRLRTTNGLERLNKEIKQRPRVAALFRNEASLLRLAFAVL